MIFLLNLLTMDPDKSNFPLRLGIYDFLMQSTDPLSDLNAPCIQQEGSEANLSDTEEEFENMISISAGKDFS